MKRDGNWLYSFGGNLPRCGAARFPEFLSDAVLLPESFRGRLLLRRRPAVTLAAGRSLPRSVETARSIAPRKLAVKRPNHASERHVVCVRNCQIRAEKRSFADVTARLGLAIHEFSSEQTEWRIEAD